MQEQPVDDPVADAEVEAAAEAAAAASRRLPPASAGLLTELGQFGRASKQLLVAQWQLLQAELGLARSAFAWMMVIGVAAFLVVNAALLTLSALIAVALAQWLGSWVAALAIVLGLQLVFVVGAALFCRRCLRWMSLPATRVQWGAILGDFKGELRRQGEGEGA